MHRCVLLNNSKYSLQPINQVRITKQSIIDYRKGKQNKVSEKQEGDLNIKFKIKIKNLKKKIEEEIKQKPLKPPDSVFHTYKVTSSVKHASCRQGPQLMDSKQ